MMLSNVQALLVLHFLLTRGSERAVTLSHQLALQLSALAHFRHVDAAGRDCGVDVQHRWVGQRVGTDGAGWWLRFPVPSGWQSFLSTVYLAIFNLSRLENREFGTPADTWWFSFQPRRHLSSSIVRRLIALLRLSAGFDDFSRKFCSKQHLPWNSKASTGSFTPRINKALCELAGWLAAEACSKHRWSC